MTPPLRLRSYHWLAAVSPLAMLGTLAVTAGLLLMTSPRFLLAEPPPAVPEMVREPLPADVLTDVPLPLMWMP